MRPICQTCGREGAILRGGRRCTCDECEAAPKETSKEAARGQAQAKA